MQRTNDWTCIRVLFTTAAAVLLFALAAGAEEPGARTVMEKNFFVIKTKTIRNKATMTLTNDKGGVRERKIDIVAKLQKNGIDSNLVIRFQYPPDVKGTGFLQLENSAGDDNLWIYLPALHKVRRLVANNKKDSFFGSDFSYGDILPPGVDLFRHTILRTEAFDAHACYVIESLPKDEKEKRNSGYGKKISWVRKDNFLESKVEYYDTEGRLLKTQLITEHKQVDPENRKWFPGRREMVNHQTGHKTLLIFSQIDVNQPVADTFFATGVLERE